VIAANKTDD